MLSDRVQLVRQRIAAACQRSGRVPASITLVAVTKTIPASLIQQAIEVGVTDLGENRVQEAAIKRETLGDLARRARWHLIGHLQSNKAKHAVELFDVIHSVDSCALIDELERQCAKR